MSQEGVRRQEVRVVSQRTLTRIRKALRYLGIFIRETNVMGRTQMLPQNIERAVTEKMIRYSVPEGRSLE